MNIEIKAAGLQDKEIIANLMQFYQYDFTDFGGEYLQSDGKFYYKYLDSYWEEEGRYPFLIYKDGLLAGMSLINKRSLLNQSDVFVIAEFFILKYFRKLGVGIKAAEEIVNRFPGRWEVSQTERNVGAQKFWLNFVTHLKGRDFKKVHLSQQKKIVLSFDN